MTITETHVCPHKKCAHVFEFTPTMAMKEPTLCPRCTNGFNRRSISTVASSTKQAAKAASKFQVVPQSGVKAKKV